MAWHREVEFSAGMGDVWASHLHGPLVFYHPSVEAQDTPALNEWPWRRFGH